MKTREQVLEEVKKGRKSGCEMIDSRDYVRLLEFFPIEEWHYFGFEPKEDRQEHTVIEWTEKNILDHLEHDLDFAFEKALNKRGISSNLMFEVIKMWMWVLDDEMQNWDWDHYAMYGLPLYKAVAIKYGFTDQIPDDEGYEDVYNG
jgi:hypothetical protein